MSSMYIKVRFDLRRNLANKDRDWTAVMWAHLPEVPPVGSMINLEGNPFFVIDVGRALTLSGNDPEQVYAYVTLIEPATCKECLGRGYTEDSLMRPCKACAKDRQRLFPPKITGLQIGDKVMLKKDPDEEIGRVVGLPAPGQPFCDVIWGGRGSTSQHPVTSLVKISILTEDVA